MAVALINKANKARLTKLYEAWSLRRSPHFPVRLLAPMMSSYQTKKGSNKLTAMILDFCKWNGHKAERTGSMGRVIVTKGSDKIKGTPAHLLGLGRLKDETKWIPSSSEKGTSDIKAYIRPPGLPLAVVIAIEVKFGTDRIKPDQIKYKESIEQAGGLYWLVWTMDEFLELYDAFMDKYK